MQRCSRRGLRLLASLEEPLQGSESLVPDRPDLLDPTDGGGKRLRSECVARLPARTSRLDEPGLSERRQVLRDGLARDGEARRELGWRRGAARRERFDDEPSAWVGECGEDANAKLMIHQGSAGFRGAPSDIQIAAREVAATTRQMAEIIGRHSGRDIEAVMEDIDRDRFMTPAEAVEYGLVDAIMPPRRAHAGK